MAKGQKMANDLVNTGNDLAVYDMGAEYEGLGLEGITAQEQLTPFLALLQALSPQCSRGRPEYLPEARPGMLCNTATGELIDGDTGCLIIPVYREHMYSKWAGERANGEFRGALTSNDPLIARLKREQGDFKALVYLDPDTREEQRITEQYNVGVLYGSPDFDKGKIRRAVIAFTSTKISVYRSWMTRIVQIEYQNSEGVWKTPPMFAHKWRLRSVPVSNKKGDFFNFELQFAERNEPSEASRIPIVDPLFRLAHEFYKQWSSGQVQADYSAAAETGETRSTGGQLDDSIPF